jgi:hypothetical protein
LWWRIRGERIKVRYVTALHAWFLLPCHDHHAAMDFLALLFGGFIGFCLGLSVGVASLLMLSSVGSTAELRDAKEKGRDRKLEAQQAYVEQMRLAVDAMRRDAARIIAEGEALRAVLPSHVKEQLKKSEEGSTTVPHLSIAATEETKQQQKKPSRHGYSREELLKLDPEKTSRSCS